VGLPIIGLDESGNTGENLLYDTQPIFTLAAVHLDHGVAAQLIEETSPGGQPAGELKFSRLRRSADGRQQILDILSSGVLTPETARVTVLHKPYMVTAKMIDILVEPGFFERGLDFHANDGALRWPNTMHEQAPSDLGEQLWAELREAFVVAVWQPSDMATGRFVGVLDRALQVSNDDRVRFPLLVMREQAEPQLRASEGVIDQLDPALAGLMEQLFEWGERLGPFEVEHDRASVVDRNADVSTRGSQYGSEYLRCSRSDGQVPARSPKDSANRFEAFPPGAARGCGRGGDRLPPEGFRWTR
jgi:hypothetical protein